MPASSVFTSAIFIPVSDKEYHSEHGDTMCREFEGTDANGNPFGGQWVLRDRDGVYVDHDAYRHDLECRWKIELQD